MEVTFNAVKSKTMFVGASSGRGSWREIINEFKYLGLWFDRHMRGAMCNWRSCQKSQRNGQERWNV